MGIVAVIYVPSMPLAFEDAISEPLISAGAGFVDIKSRYDAYHVGCQGGWLSANDIRRWEDMNPLPGKAGDVW